MFTFNINYPAGLATVVSFLSLVCHTVQFVFLAKFDDPKNWTSKIPPRYIMTFIAGADSCLTGYFFLRAERIKKNKARSIALVTLIISIVSVVLYALRDTSTWIPGPYYGGGYSSECGLLTGYTKLRCQLIDVTFVSMIVAAGCWFIAMFGSKPEPKSRKNKNKDADVESVILNYDNPHKQQATITIIQEEFNPDQGKRVPKENKRDTMETRPSDRTVVNDEKIEFLDEKEYKA